MTYSEIQRLMPDGTCLDANGSLQIGGHDLASLARDWGTPLYVYHARTFYNQVDVIRSLIARYYPGSFDISFAGKAYLSYHFAKKINDCGLTLDAISLGEMLIAQKAGIPAEKVHLHGNNKSGEELSFALDWGVDNIVVDSLEEMDFLESIAAGLNKPANIWMRITPGVDVKTHPYVQTAHTTSKFGFPIEDGQAAKGIRTAKNSAWLRLKGLHMHIGSQIFQVEPYLQALKAIIHLAESEQLVLEQISPGGGWGVPYTPDQPDIDLPLLISRIADLLTSECERLQWKLPRLVVEPGRRLIARAGVSVYSVGTTKNSSDGTRFVSLDGGMADNPRPALYQSRYTAMALNHAETDLAPCTLVGKYCETGDKLISDVLLPPVQRGALIAIPVSGAYQLSMASNYNLTNRPAVLWLEDGQVELMQPRERVQESRWWVGDAQLEPLRSSL